MPLAAGAGGAHNRNWPTPRSANTRAVFLVNPLTRGHALLRARTDTRFLDQLASALTVAAIAVHHRFLPVDVGADVPRQTADIRDLINLIQDDICHFRTSIDTGWQGQDLDQCLWRRKNQARLPCMKKRNITMQPLG